MGEGGTRHMGAPVLRAIGSITGGLSLLGSVMIIAVFAPKMRQLYLGPSKTTSHQQKIKALRGGYQFTLLWLAISDAVVGAAWLSSAVTPPDESPRFCPVQGFLIEFGVVSSAMWTACLAHELSRFITRLNEEVHGNFAMRRYRIYLCLSWGLALVLALIGGIVGDFASAGGWCWIKNSFDMVQFLLGYVPLFGVLIFLWWLHRTFKDRLDGKAECLKLLKLGTFPATFFCVWFIPLLARLFYPDSAGALDAAAGPTPLITAFLAPSQGWINALVYTCINKSVMQQVLKTFGCRRCARREPQHPPSAPSSSSRGGPSSSASYMRLTDPVPQQSPAV